MSNTDVIINGVWTEDVAFGENALPSVQTGSTVYSNAPALIVPSDGAVIATDDTVNRRRASLSLPASGNKAFSVTSVGTSFDIEVTVRLEDGLSGVSVARINGNTAGTKFVTKTESLIAGLSINYNVAVNGTCVSVTVTNGTVYTIPFTVDVRSKSGGLIYLNS